MDSIESIKCLERQGIIDNADEINRIIASLPGDIALLLAFIASIKSQTNQEESIQWSDESNVQWSNNQNVQFS